MFFIYLHQVFNRVYNATARAFLCPLGVHRKNYEFFGVPAIYCSCECGALLKQDTFRDYLVKDCRGNVVTVQAIDEHHARSLASSAGNPRIEPRDVVAIRPLS